MSSTRILLDKIENTRGDEQQKWVDIYNKYISSKLKRYLLENYKENNPLVSYENGAIKYTEYTKEEREKIIKELEEYILKIDTMMRNSKE